MLRFPGRESSPRVDEHLVHPETREEMVRGRRLLAMPAKPPQADRHFGLDYVLGGHVEPGWVGSTDLLTRTANASDFASDTCIRKAGTDPVTGARYLEEVAFEVVNEQSRADATERAEDLSARGVRRVFAIFVKTGEVCEWSTKKSEWCRLGPEAILEDVCLSRPLRVKALLDATEADDAVAKALEAKGTPAILEMKATSRSEGLADGLADGRTEGVVRGKAAAVVAVLAARGVALSEAARARILACADEALADRWLAAAAVARSVDEVLGEVLGEGAAS